ncbi:I78 family peptidase inhibitor [Streptomyces tirandamycinicus]|uniref:Proteinase inhibitor I78 n=1 Tax=Streptomyces tirandamycinicus TaxID=2174846 RepID=A0A2S1SQB8_9ACTN|nr:MULTISPECIES: I78 family peptidase inhibitor [Streptomyces]AWI28576.1 proteinase inhibitor I78 [Streptomyces tirandamycinicus]MCY0985322.1 I78 family peptidase inhibitor [Streptomyces tirandamycinicus]NNJ06919.1 proteinase inhibitor I78 [Streptomyces sp. PKU-MA01144]TFE56145.1 proteinase inhibitor I78 [Streptomyces sp. ICN441]
MAPTPIPEGQPDDAPETYVGLDADQAESRARGRGWTTVRSLPPGSVITMEYLEGRLNFEVDHGTVVRCWTG